MKKGLFLDTNVFLHYQDFDNINWTKEVGSEVIAIIVPPIIIKELQKQKEFHPRTEIKKRAGNILRKLATYFESGANNQLKSGVEIHLEDRDPINYFSSNQLNPSSGDDNLIASMIMFGAEHPEITPILITSDDGLLLLSKARKFGIKSFVLPDNLRLPDSPNPEQVKIKQLENEISGLKNRIPVLSLAFEDGRQSNCISIRQPIELTAQMVEDGLGDIRAKFPKISATNELVRNRQNMETVIGRMIDISKLFPTAYVTDEQISEYNTKLEKYYAEYADYLVRRNELANLARRAFELGIYLKNEGTAPAEDIDILMTFPVGAILVNYKELVIFPRKPIPPQKPEPQAKTMNDWIKNLSNTYDRYPFIPDISGPIPLLGNVSNFKIQKDGDYKLSIHVQRVKHGLAEKLRPLYFAFGKYEEASSFQINYQLLAANAPRKICGKLNIIVKKQ